MTNQMDQPHLHSGDHALAQGLRPAAALALVLVHHHRGEFAHDPDHPRPGDKARPHRNVCASGHPRPAHAMRRDRLLWTGLSERASWRR